MSAASRPSLSDTPAPRTWLPGDPWFWITVGLLLCVGAWLMMALHGPGFPAVRYTMLVAGLLACGGALTIRIQGVNDDAGSSNAAAPVYLNRLPAAQRSVVLLILAGLFALMAIGVTAVLLDSWLGVGNIRYSWGQVLFWWIVVAPMASIAAMHSFRQLSTTVVLQPREEAAALLLLAGLACFAGWWSLYDPNDPDFLDTIRLFLGVTLLVCLVSAPLVVVPQSVRRRVISLLILLHFGGIVTAGLASPPAPLPIRQLWTRIYRPYLEFTYLINAYHFYAPEPGPTSYLWFRVHLQNSEGGQIAQWVKIPDLDEKSNYRYSMGLTYQRYVAITENTIPTDAPPSFYVIHPDGSLGPAPFYFRRVMHAPRPAQEGVIIGVPRASTGSAVPWHPDLPQNQQYLPPTSSVKGLIESYVRHVAWATAHEDYEVETIKVYRVIHTIPMAEMYLSGVQEPDDPDTYRPIFLGDYDAAGKLLDADEPFLYWMLPTTKENRMSRNSRYFSYARKHAGDPNWIRDEQKQWVAK